MKLWLASIVLVVAIVAASFWAHQRSYLMPHDNAARTLPVPTQDEPQRRGVLALARVEPRDGIIDVTALMGDRLASLAVKEGDTVSQGDVLGLLDSYELKRMELAVLDQQIAEAEARRVAESNLADARIAAAEIAVEQAESVQHEIDAQKKQIAVLEKNLTAANNDLGRIRKLSKELVSEQQLERQSLVVDTAEAELVAAQATLNKLVQGRALNLRAARSDLEAAKASKAQVVAAVPVESLKQSRNLTQAQLDRSQIRAPAEGTVLRTLVQPGESIGREPILQLADLNHMVVVAEVYEADVKRIETGQPALISSSAFPKPYDKQDLPGTVKSIGRMISAPAMRSLDPLAPVDRHVVEVRVEIAPEHAPVVAELINLQVDVWFPAGEEGEAE